MYGKSHLLRILLSWYHAFVTCMNPVVQSPVLHDLDAVAHASNPSTWVVEAGRLGSQDHPWLSGKFEACLDCMKPYLRN